ncbi:DNA-directed RNA polymerases I and III subunit RPAC1-like [Zophobas morio]|uniref:DNA-directed RNA polymerases I and III subunit RPAC1-like n=1 Tax=Zophobas morio TaxID=2755281 RepID=UPI003083BC5D
MSDLVDPLLKKVRTRIVLKEDEVKFTSSSDFPRSIDGIDDSWNLFNFKKNLRVAIGRLDRLDMEFDLVGVDAAIANAFRRICLVEMPTMAIEKVWIFNNTSVMPDEVLCHRLGLVPIDADPFEFNYFDENAPEEVRYTDANTIIFNLSVKCDPLTKKQKKERSLTGNLKTIDVTTKDLKWSPAGTQLEDLASRPPRPLHDDIVLLKLAPNQEIDVQMFCLKGIGKTHAKWSPVATCSYRLLPEIIIKEPIYGQDAYDFQKCFSEGVIDVIKNKRGIPEAVVKNPRMDTLSREVFRHPKYAKKVELSRIRDHFIYFIESTGALPPHTIFSSAIEVLSNKCDVFLEALNNLST